MTDRLAAADRPQAAPKAGEPSDAAGRSPIRSGRGELDRLWARGRAFLGTDLAVMGGAMTWVSERHLVAAISNAGGFGVIASGSMSPELLAAEIAATAERTDKPFGVNLITMHPQLMGLIDVCLEQRVGHVVLAGGLPSGAAIGRLRDGGAQVVCFAPALVIARKVVRMGANAIVIEGNRCIEGFRALAGATDPTAALPGTIRGDLGRDWGLAVQQNIVHGSDSPESASREIGIWFPELG